MILLIDNFDSFTYNLVDYFEQLGVTCEVARNTCPLERLVKKDYKAVVLSPGPGKPEHAGVMLEVIQWYLDKLPILGVCLGCQAIGQHFGAKVVKAQRPMHGKVSKIECRKNAVLFTGLPTELSVVRYHSLVLDQVPDTLDVTAIAPNGEIMALQHKTQPISGLQFHPEAVLTENGLQMLENWVAYYMLVD